MLKYPAQGTSFVLWPVSYIPIFVVVSGDTNCRALGHHQRLVVGLTLLLFVGLMRDNSYCGVTEPYLECF